MDKLLKAIKDSSSIRTYLEAINQTTDDFLYTFDIPSNRLEFFGPIHDVFRANEKEEKEHAVEEVYYITNCAARQGNLRYCAFFSQKYLTKRKFGDIMLIGLTKRRYIWKYS